MLQLMEKASTVFNVKENIKLQKLQPFTVRSNIFNCICNRCRYVNSVTNNFCTNCGYPVKEEGISFLFSDLDNRYLLVLASATFSGLFFLLARWSYSKPFTAIITGFIIVLTFSTISIFGEFVNAFTTVVGVYSILVTMILIYFLLRGVQGAYKVDLIKEEMEII